MSIVPAKKILLISSEFPPNTGGIGNHAFCIAGYLSENSYVVTVLADIIDVDKKELGKFQSGINFRFYPVIRSKWLIKTYFERIVSALQLAKSNEIIISSGKFSLWMGALISFFSAKKKFIAIVHGSELDLKNKIAKRITTYSLTCFHSFIAVSDFTAGLLPVKIKQTNKVSVIHNGISIEEFNPAHADKLKGHPSVITVGSVSERKGQENVIKALPGLLRVFPQLQYHIIGKPVIKHQLEKMCKELRVDDAVIFYGAVSRKKLIQLIAGCDVKMMLSNYTAKGDFEGFGIALLEANALGKPVIGSSLGGIPEAIVNEQTGIIVNAKNADEIQAALQNIMNHYEAYSQNALRWAGEHDWKILIQQYISVIESV